MPKKVKYEPCCSEIKESSCCKVEGLISVDERGQMVLPKELRQKANIKPQDKLAVVSWEKDGKVCCISLINVKELTELITTNIGPIITQILQNK